MSDQMIFKRYEMKYLLSRAQYLQITEAFDGRMKPDIHGKSTILSLYFDTPDDLLIRRSLEKPLYKEKLRVRSYGIADTDTTVFVELKKNINPLYTKGGLQCPKKKPGAICFPMLPLWTHRSHGKLTTVSPTTAI